jgi:glycine dehydrogenase subunit 1
MPFIQNSDNDLKAMLKRIGVENFEELLDSIPEDLRKNNDFGFTKALSEPEVKKHLYTISKNNKNCIDNISFLGGGIYDHYIPAVIDHIVSRSEFYTAYTPYQAEVSQGTLAVMYEFQTLVNRLTGMEVTNDSMYDCGTALAEAAHMARVITNKHSIIVSETVNPQYIDVIKTYSYGLNIPIIMIPSINGITDIEEIEKSIDNDTSAVIVQSPNYFGMIENMDRISEIVHKNNLLFISVYDPISLGILKTPGEYNADIAIAEGQSLGNYQAFGGPLLGLFSTRKKFLRQMPGRLVGLTEDIDGNTGFVMTLQTREQHIKRDRATSNICTNEALCMTRAAIYLILLGKNGLKEISETCLRNSHYLFDELIKIDGISPLFNGLFFKEFAVKLPIPSDVLIADLEKKGIYAGIDLCKFNKALSNSILISVTETKSRIELDKFIDEVKIFLN